MRRLQTLLEGGGDVTSALGQHILRGSCKARPKYNRRAMEILGFLLAVVLALLSLTKLPQICRLKSADEKLID